MALADLYEDASAPNIRRALATSVVTTQPAPPSGMTPRALCFRDGPVYAAALGCTGKRGRTCPEHQKGTCHICGHNSASPALGHDAEGAMRQRRTRVCICTWPQFKRGRTCPDHQKGTCHICGHPSASTAHGQDAMGAMSQRRTIHAAYLAACIEDRIRRHLPLPESRVPRAAARQHDSINDCCSMRCP